MALGQNQKAFGYRTIQTLPEAVHPGSGDSRRPRSQLTHVNVTLSNLHRLQASILEEVPACHLRGEQVKGDLTTGFGVKAQEGK